MPAYAIRGRGAVDNNGLRGFVLLWGIQLVNACVLSAKKGYLGLAFVIPLFFHFSFFCCLWERADIDGRECKVSFTNSFFQKLPSPLFGTGFMR